METKTITVQDIHNDFNDYPTHLSRVLQEMDMDLKKDIRNYEKLNKLSKLGFSKITENVQDPKYVFQFTKEEHERISELYFEYNRRFKFISKKGIDHLCQKYNLFHGRVQNFTAGIPEKNADEILASQDEDFGYNPVLTVYFNGKALIFDRYSITSTMYMDRVIIDDLGFNDLVSFDITIKDNLGNIVYSYDKNNRHAMMRMGSDRIFDLSRFMTFSESGLRNTEKQRESLASDSKALMLEEYRLDLKRTLSVAMRKANKEMQDTCYSIVANHSDFSVLESADTKEIELTIPDMRFPDPIVFKKTRHSGIYAIITAWDKEASDPLVVNQSLN